MAILREETQSDRGLALEATHVLVDQMHSKIRRQLYEEITKQCRGDYILHIRGEEVVLVDANLDVTLYRFFVDGDVFLDSSLKLRKDFFFSNELCLTAGCDHSD